MTGIFVQPGVSLGHVIGSATAHHRDLRAVRGQLLCLVGGDVTRQPPAASRQAARPVCDRVCSQWGQ
jgi:hypothetical protein